MLCALNLEFRNVIACGTCGHQFILRSQRLPFHNLNFSFSLSTYSKAVTVFTQVLTE
jgi:hypothetical protein